MTGYQSKKLMAQSRNPEPDDLVKRLKRLIVEITDREKHKYRWSDEFIAMKIEKAVDRIEALEEALREIACDQSVSPCTCVNERECSYGIARAALGEKKDG